jgi:DNA-binding transcriptional LysR family regulator
VQKSTDKPAALDWDGLRYFLELARQGTLSGAARALAVEHSTVARRVAALERSIGVRLFDRLPKSWVLTPEGEELLLHARRVEDEAHAFGRASLGVSALVGIVRLSAPPAFTSHFLVPRLAALRRQWPAIRLDITGEVREANLFRREADLALRLSRPEEPGLATRPLAEMGFGLYGSAEWAALPAEQWEFVGYDDSLSQALQQQWLSKFAGSRPFALRSNDLATLYQACRAGLGVAALPHFLARGDTALQPMPGVDCPVKRGMWLVLHPDVRRSPRVKAVAEGLTELLREHAALLG